MTSRSNNVVAITVITRLVVLADWIFTAPAVLFQLITGIALMLKLGYSFTSPWAISVFALYALIAVCWLPVVGIQYKLRALAEQSLQNEQMAPAFSRWMRLWTLLGIPAFICVGVLLYLMVFKPMSVV